MSTITSDQIQEFSSIILVMVTIFYAVITNRMLHAPYNCFLKPISLTFDNNNWVMKIRNFGQGTAFYVSLKTISISKIEPDPVDGLNKIWFETDMVTANGSSEILPNTEVEFTFDADIYRFTLKDPFYIEWRTSLGKKQKSGWLYMTDYRLAEYRPLSYFERFKFASVWIYKNIKSPFVRVKRWLRFRKIEENT